MPYTDREKHNAYYREYRQRNLLKLRKYRRDWAKAARRKAKRVAK